MLGYKDTGDSFSLLIRLVFTDPTGVMTKICRKVDVELDWTWDGVVASNRSSSTSRGHRTLPELEPMRIEMRFTSQQYRHRFQTRTIKLKVPFSSTARLPCPVRQLGNRTVRAITCST